MQKNNHESQSKKQDIRSITRKGKKGVPKWKITCAFWFYEKIDHRHEQIPVITRKNLISKKKRFKTSIPITENKQYLTQLSVFC